MEINLVDLWWIALSGQLEGHSWITGVLASTEMPDISCTGDEQLVENQSHLFVQSLDLKPAMAATPQLCPLATDPPGELDVLGHDGDALGVDGAQVGVVALEGVDHVHGGDGLPLGMLGVCDGVLYHEGGRRRPVAV